MAEESCHAALAAQAASRISENILKMCLRDREWANQLFRELARNDILCITRLDERYPALLKDIYDPPATLFVRGNPDLDFARALAVVGTCLLYTSHPHPWAL